MRRLLFIAVCMALVGACTPKPDEAPLDPKAALIKRGRLIYVQNCVACHHTDPRQVGSIGPEVAHASLAVLKARIIDQKYPEDYKPKRSTNLMPKLPHLEPELPALEAYLAQ